VLFRSINVSAATFFYTRLATNSVSSTIRNGGINWYDATTGGHDIDIPWTPFVFNGGDTNLFLTVMRESNCTIGGTNFDNNSFTTFTIQRIQYP
jgi:hypothetical protein